MTQTFFYLSGLYREVQSTEVSPEEEPELYNFLSKSPCHFKTLEEAEIERAFIQLQQKWK